MTDHLHNYGDPLSAAEPHARRCSSCGEPQVYNPPTGKSEFPYVMMIKKVDLRRLLVGHRRPLGDVRRRGLDDLCDRMELLLD